MNRKEFMKEVILIGVDDSESAHLAAESAASLASALGGELHIVSASNVNLTETYQRVRSQNLPAGQVNAYRDLESKHATKAELTSSLVADKIRLLFPDIKIHSKGLSGVPGVALVSEANRIGANIIVVGNRRVQGPARILGSIARAVASEANCDVYIVNTHKR